MSLPENVTRTSSLSWQAYPKSPAGHRLEHLPLERAPSWQVGHCIESLPPGMSGCPLHYHLREEEHFYVLSGELTVRELHGRLRAEGRDWAYTTVQTMLQRLADKGYVGVDRSGVAHVFRSRVSRAELLDRRLDELADKFCDGATAGLLLNLVERHRFTPAEIARFRRLLEDATRPEPPEDAP